MNDLKLREVYQHYKGGRYMLLALARMEATGEDAVVYQGVNDSKVWVRPLAEFTPPRFELVPRQPSGYEVPSAKQARAHARAEAYGRPRRLEKPQKL